MVSNGEHKLRSECEIPVRIVPSFHITHIVDKTPQHILLLLQEEFEDTKRVIRIRNHQPMRTLCLTERYILHMQVLHMNGKLTMGKLKSSLLS